MLAVAPAMEVGYVFSGASADAGSPPLVLAGGAERVFALAAQIGFSVMVMKSVREKKPLWLLLAFVLHTLVDFGAAYAAGFLGDGAGLHRQQLSALIDGELSADQARFLIRRLEHDQEL